MQALDHVMAGCTGHPILSFLMDPRRGRSCPAQKDRADPQQQCSESLSFWAHCVLPAALWGAVLVPFRMSAIHPSKDNEKIRILLPWEKGSDFAFGCTRPPHLSRSFMKRGNTYSVRYTYTDHHGKPCQGWVSFKSKKEKALNPTIQRFLSSAPPGTRTLGPLIKRNSEAIFVHLEFYEES